MNQLLKKFALLTACAALALCFTAQSAQAQRVEPGGVGEHLFFGYWSTGNYTNTNVNIHSPLGVTGAVAPDKNVVYVRVRNTAPDRNVVVSFNICLTAGDSWTATMSMDSLMVMDEGGCDGDLRELSTSNPSDQNLASPPMMGEMVDLGESNSGYIEAWLNPANTLKDDTVGAPDSDHNPEDGSAMPISGTAMLVSPMSGFASSYNAVALSMCGNVKAADRVGNADGVLVTDETAKTIAQALALTRDATNTDAVDATTANAKTLNGDDGNGCWHVRTFFTAATTGADAMPAMIKNVDSPGAPINMALGDAGAMGGGDRDLLTGRWTAIDDDNVMSHTKVILTLPMNQFSQADGADPVSIHVYDDMGGVVGWSSGLTLGTGVNMCMFGGMDMMGMLTCNGEEVLSLGGAMSGEFRIFNNRLKAGGIGELPELSNQTPAESIAAVGLIFSYFEGTDGKKYDQVTPIGWIDVDRDGNDPDAADAPDTAAGFTDTGLDDF